MEAKIDEILKLVMQHGNEIRTIRQGQDELRGELGVLREDHERLRDELQDEEGVIVASPSHGVRVSPSTASPMNVSPNTTGNTRARKGGLRRRSDGSPSSSAAFSSPSPGRHAQSPARRRLSFATAQAEAEDESFGGLLEGVDAEWPAPIYSAPRLNFAPPRPQKDQEEEDMAEDARRGGLWGLCQPLLNAFAKAKMKAAALSQVEHALARGVVPSSWAGPSTPLRTSVQHRCLDLVHVLLEARGSPDEQDARGVSLLHTASFEGQIEICKLLLEHRANPNIADQYRQTPIFFAPSRSICDMLFTSFADIAIANHKGQSALHHAGKAGLGDVLSYLAARATRALIRLRDSQGSTCIDLAREAGMRPDALTKVEKAARGGLTKAVASDKKRGVFKSSYSQSAMKTTAPTMALEDVESADSDNGTKGSPGAAWTPSRKDQDMDKDLRMALSAPSPALIALEGRQNFLDL